MIETSATVVEVKPGLAWVETVRQNACGHCESAGSCGTSVLAKLFGASRSRLRIEDASGLRVGEQVVIGIPDGILVRASFVAYLIPLVFLIAAAGVATHLGAGEGRVALIGLAGLGVGLWASGRLTGGASARERYRPVLVRRGSAVEIPMPF
ncbi:SoxR reducing system RseC family protein [Thiocapsa marina]|uniref:Positive regulator of sigma E, RseC/MucC n=1 Tax=Thiocapsa marina 5811 TaxID=768671 RepID=F9UIA5_9GAMM|nr:SoxR reducing system RseC family protein [Thiocapsa marina]EGV16057.1 positive regulator of sigma E, RseC/MucC [Thiocapsa marina 5811]